MVPDTAATVYKHVEQLVRRHVAPYAPSPEQSQQLVALSLRIIGSRIQSRVIDPLAVSERIKKRLITNSRKLSGRTDESGLTVALRFQELYVKLMVQDLLRNKGSILRVLFCLADFAQDSLSNVEFVATSLSSLQLPLKALTESDKPPSQFKNTKPITSETPTVDQSLRKPSSRPSEIKRRLSFEIPEHVLLRDILFAFQGIDSVYIKYSSKSECYEVVPDVRVSTSTRNLVTSLAELGWLFSKVAKFIEETERKTTKGLVIQSFCYALQAELTSYYRLLAVLEAQLSDAEATTARQSSAQLTLRRLAVWTQDPLEKLRIMAALVDSVYGMEGGALASAIYAQTQHGDPLLSQFVEKLLRQLCIPIFTMIRRWIFEGELEDPEREFFISADQSVTEGEQIWFHKYKLNAKMIPRFISRELAEKILIIGKSINFMRQCCSDAEWVIDSVAVAVAQADGLDYGQIARLDAVISQAASVTNRRLTEVLLTRYKLLDHCKALKSYLLLGQGDFIQCLMDHLEPELSKRATQIYRHNLMGVLESAINASNAKYEAQEFLDRLDVKLYSPSPGDEGWDVFALHYKLTSPIDAVIGEQAMKEYLQIFNFLWRLKRMEYSLALCWRRDMNLVRIVKEIPELRATVHQSHLLRCQMIHFTSNLHNYMMFEVLETSWSKLVQDLKSAVDLDQLIKGHYDYLNQIKSKSFMTGESRDVFDKLRGLFEVIIRFCRTHEMLYGAALKEYHRRKIETQEIQKRTERGEWGVIDDSDMSALGDQSQLGGVSRHCIQSSTDGRSYANSFLALLLVLVQCEEIAQSYGALFLQLLDVLTTRSAGSENLRFLTFRLNFNEYYDKEKVRGEAEPSELEQSLLPPRSS